MSDLRLGRWENVLADVGEVDCVMSDPPYSDRTHTAYREMESVGRNPIRYAAFSEQDVDAIVDAWAPRTRGWMAFLCDHGLAPAYERAMGRHDRYVFAPLACVEPGSRVRLSGDGPCQWSVWLIVSRPRNREFQRWGALPGAYVVPTSHGWRGPASNGGRSGVTGGKPLWLMRALVRDYTKPGALIVDPCAGAATTLIAASIEGRRAIGAECDPETYAIAKERIGRPFTPDIFATYQENSK